MNVFDHLDEQFARQFGGLPRIAAPVAPGALDLPTAIRADGLLLGNADLEIYHHEAIHGICAQGDCDEQ